MLTPHLKFPQVFSCVILVVLGFGVVKRGGAVFFMAIFLILGTISIVVFGRLGPGVRFGGVLFLPATTTLRKSFAMITGSLGCVQGLVQGLRFLLGSSRLSIETSHGIGTTEIG